MIQDYKKIIVIFIALGILVFGVIMVNSIRQAGKVAVNITYAPGNAVISIDNKVVKDTKCTKPLCTKKVYVEQGNREISLEMVNFSKDTVNINTDQVKEAYLIIQPTNPAGERYFEQDEYAQIQIQNASSAEQSNGSENISQRYNFLDKLNIYGSGYTIGYGASSYMQRDPYSVAIYIDATTPQSRQEAVKAVTTDLGVSPGDIEIIYNDFINPFEDGQ